MDESFEFRKGFLYGLAAMGLTPEDLGRRLLQQQPAHVKQALGFGEMGDLALATAVGGPIVLGALGGAAAAKLIPARYNDPVQGVRDTELIRQMRLATRQLNRRQRRPNAAGGSIDSGPSFSRPPAPSFGATPTPGLLSR
jgi:hypothetical protein